MWDKSISTWRNLSFLVSPLESLANWKNGQHRFLVPYFSDTRASSRRYIISIGDQIDRYL